MTRIFELSLILRNFLALILLHIPIKAITPGAAHSPPVIEILLNFLSFRPAIVFAIFLSEIDTQQSLALFNICHGHYTTFHP